MIRGGRAAATGLSALVLAACGEERAAPLPDPFEAVEPTAVLSPEEKQAAAPRWERLARLGGDGPATRELEVPGRAIQWRVRWRCRDGERITMRLDPPPAAGARLLDAACPGRGTATAVEGGRFRLSVRSGGAWSATVEHQVDAPLAEPPLRGMTKNRIVARGRFAPMERRGEGTATVYRLPDGRLALRLDPFTTTPSTDLEIWASPARRPRTSRAAVRAPHVRVAYLKSTAGSQNYLLPRRMPISRLRSLVLWCEPLYMAYASAGLRPR